MSLYYFNFLLSKATKIKFTDLLIDLSNCDRYLNKNKIKRLERDSFEGLTSLEVL